MQVGRWILSKIVINFVCNMFSFYYRMFLFCFRADCFFSFFVFSLFRPMRIVHEIVSRKNLSAWRTRNNRAERMKACCRKWVQGRNSGTLKSIVSVHASISHFTRILFARPPKLPRLQKHSWKHPSGYYTADVI